MLKVTYLETGLCLEYYPEPLDMLMSDRVCTYARAHCAMSIQPSKASILLAASLATRHGLERFEAIEISVCDPEFFEVTFSGLWITEGENQDTGVFLTELMPRLEQRIFRLWQLSQRSLPTYITARGCA